LLNEKQEIMFTLELFDRLGQKLNLGDIVKVSNGKDFTFFAEVKYLAEEQIISPFHTFCFHSFEKVNEVPESAVKGSETRYKIWYNPIPAKDSKESARLAEKYLTDWRVCERLLEQRVFRINPIEQPKLF
jgi:hypothetical protein